jgi:putative toxin-antitoxin system antitoxin component (TIGR02293 family)
MSLNMKVDKEYSIYEETHNVVAEALIQYNTQAGNGIASLIEIARKGLKMSYLHLVSKGLSLSLQEISTILHVSMRTLQRYAASKVLDSDISAKLLHLDALKTEGVDVFGSERDFNVWLRTELPVLQGHTPLSYLDTPFGFQLVQQVLGRIKHGIFA